MDADTFGIWIGNEANLQTSTPARNDNDGLTESSQAFFLPQLVSCLAHPALDRSIE
jgi:hypothetical protein